MNRDTALSDELLLSIEKPERYIGNELNAIYKEKSRVAIRFAMCFPDIYEIGMSHLGIQILYHMFNEREDVWCERVYSPALDLDKLMREEKLPLFALESQDPVKDFDFLGITLQYEMCYTNVLQVLDLSGIPLSAGDRAESDPIVIGGGPCAYNPEPIAEFFDIFYIGEGEVSYDALFDAYIINKKRGGSRLDFLKSAAQIPGLYVPSFYDTEYNEDGTIKAFYPNNEWAPDTVKKQLAADLDSAPFPDQPLVPFIKVTQDRAVLEVMRGCIRGCRFCQAGQIYKPLRERSTPVLKEYARRILESTGYDEVTLSSLSTSDYSGLSDITGHLVNCYGDKYVNLSLPSLRIDAFSLEIMSRVQDVRKSSLTFAPEAGSQRLRDVINKGLTEEDILKGAGDAFQGGWNKVKLYFMLGLPTEEDSDAEAIADLSDRVAKHYFDVVPKEERKGIRVQVNSSASFFVPKPFTPFQWAAMNPLKEFVRKARLVKDTFLRKPHKKSLRFQYHDSSLSVLEGVFARGDRKLSKVIKKAYEKGCLFDAWTEYFHFERWEEAFKECGIDMDFYTVRERPISEILPWDFIDIGVKRSFLEAEWKRALEGQVTKNCRESCAHCGMAARGLGVCVRK